MRGSTVLGRCSIIDPQNVASIRVAKKLGMRYEKEVLLHEYTHPDQVHALERTGVRREQSDPSVGQSPADADLTRLPGAVE